ncbi:hypothetical protein HRbin33_02192 [bacterium HR33]|nr:hypothetical protein HRbin33_02192 [bacterium HR33]
MNQVRWLERTAIAVFASLAATIPHQLAAAPAFLPQADTVRLPTAAAEDWPYLERGILPMIPAQVPSGPMAPGSRYTFTRDSILWSGAQTLADLLATIPGVYVARGGFLGLPEYIAYAGRGAAALELYWDGLPIYPLGPDSVHLDAGRISLNYLRRVDVEVLPGTLRVYLVSERHETTETRSLIRVLSGDFRTASYTGLFQQRWKNGLGLDLAGNFLGTRGASGPNRDDQAFDLWAKGEWLAGPTAGVSYQLRRQQYDRDPVTQSRDPGAVPVAERIAAQHGARTDVLFEIFAASRPFGMGFGTRAGLGFSSWTNDSVLGERHLRQGYLSAGYRTPDLTAELRGRLADARTPSQLEARVGWIPVPGLVLSGDASWSRHSRHRRSLVARGTAALYRGPLWLSGEIVYQDRVQAPALEDDTAQLAVDWSLKLGLREGPITGFVGLVHRDHYVPLPFGELKVVPLSNPAAERLDLVAAVRIQPLQPLVLEGWYTDPVDPPAAAADFQPPTHARVQLTFRSKFWRTFRSGAFDLKVQVGMESWSSGVAGATPEGTPIALEGVTFSEALVAFQIVDFTMFWTLKDALNVRKQYVPGLGYPNNAQLFGVRWEFRN